MSLRGQWFLLNYEIHYLGDQKAETAAIAELQSIIRGVNTDLGDKVGELQKQDKMFRDLQAQQVRATSLPLHCTLSIIVISGKSC